jgi:hypothetical protein
MLHFRGRHWDCDIDNIPSVKYYDGMRDKHKYLTVQEAGRRGGKERAKRYPPDQLREWAKLGGWPKGRSRKKKRRTKKREVSNDL